MNYSALAFVLTLILLAVATSRVMDVHPTKTYTAFKDLNRLMFRRDTLTLAKQDTVTSFKTLYQNKGRGCSAYATLAFWFGLPFIYFVICVWLPIVLLFEIITDK